MRMPSLTKINLRGTGIGENLGEILEALRQPGIKTISLQQNGLTKECTLAFAKYMVNFENIIELHLGINWFGIQGLWEIKDELARFVQIKTLGLGTNKLCIGDPDDLP